VCCFPFRKLCNALCTYSKFLHQRHNFCGSD
jgi:hypothetical protein